MLDNFIGQHQFIVLAGNPVAPVEEIEGPIRRKGVDGLGLSKTGKRGRPFTLRSKVDAQDIDEAKDMVKRYRELIGAAPVSLIHDDYNFNQEDWRVAVLDVRTAVIHAVATATGGLNEPSEAWLEVDWVLIAIEN